MACLREVPALPAEEWLRQRGVGNCCIGWTWLLDFYGRLGYRPWRSYAMSWREW